jgi:hypothetical protein
MSVGHPPSALPAQTNQTPLSPPLATPATAAPALINHSHHGTKPTRKNIQVIKGTGIVSLHVDPKTGVYYRSKTMYHPIPQNDIPPPSRNKPKFTRYATFLAFILHLLHLFYPLIKIFPLVFPHFPLTIFLFFSFPFHIRPCLKMSYRQGWGWVPWAPSCELDLLAGPDHSDDQQLSPRWREGATKIHQ